MVSWQTLHGHRSADIINYGITKKSKEYDKHTPTIRALPKSAAGPHSYALKDIEATSAILAASSIPTMKRLPRTRAPHALDDLCPAGSAGNLNLRSEDSTKYCFRAGDGIRDFEVGQNHAVTDLKISARKEVWCPAAGFSKL